MVTLVGWMESGPAGCADLISSAVLLDNKVITAIREGDGDLSLHPGGLTLLTVLSLD